MSMTLALDMEDVPYWTLLEVGESRLESGTQT